MTPEISEISTRGDLAIVDGIVRSTASVARRVSMSPRWILLFVRRITDPMFSHSSSDFLSCFPLLEQEVVCDLSFLAFSVEA